MNPSTRSFLHTRRRGTNPTARQVGKGSLPTENALTSVLIGMGMSTKAPEFPAWQEKRRELEAANVERSVLESHHAEERPLAPAKNGYTPLHKQDPPISRQRSYLRQRFRRRSQPDL
ncbi:hypothetical protein [Streptomyces sp. MMBL 11-3]|uniref:hypothetical protein n=1 Tax=Streptomyces sp. MMBL 11-3 TaxID=3382639 RepID=UPI0039B5E589